MAWPTLGSRTAEEQNTHTHTCARMCSVHRSLYMALRSNKRQYIMWCRGYDGTTLVNIVFWRGTTIVGYASRISSLHITRTRPTPRTFAARRHQMALVSRSQQNGSLAASVGPTSEPAGLETRHRKWRMSCEQYVNQKCTEILLLGRIATIAKCGLLLETE